MSLYFLFIPPVCSGFFSYPIFNFYRPKLGIENKSIKLKEYKRPDFVRINHQTVLNRQLQIKNFKRYRKTGIKSSEHRTTRISANRRGKIKIYLLKAYYLGPF